MRASYVEHRKPQFGFTLIELMVAMTITIIVMAAVYRILTQGQRSMAREPEISELQQSARTALQTIDRDLTMAGYSTPGPSSIMWTDGGGANPDQITIIYADPKVPTSRPLSCMLVPGPCDTIGMSSTVFIAPHTLNPHPAVPENAYSDGMVLFAIETEDCNGDDQNGLVPFELTQDPVLVGTGGGSLKLNHNPGQGNTDLNPPNGFNNQVSPECALIGFFHVVQYRIHPLPPTPHPTLERRDLSMGGTWTPVAANIENVQFKYATSVAGFVDSPALPRADDPTAWISRVKVTVTARTESKGLPGATSGVFALQDIYVRKAFSTAVTLRNQVLQAQTATNSLTYN